MIFRVGVSADICGSRCSGPRARSNALRRRRGRITSRVCEPPIVNCFNRAGGSSDGRALCEHLGLPAATAEDIFGPHTLQAFIARTERVQNTAHRRVLQGERVPNSEKLFSMFEPHTQLFKRGKAGQPVQYGRLVLLYEDAAGFLIHHHLMPRDASDKDVVVA